MKKRKLEKVVVARSFLRDLLEPFQPMKVIDDIKIEDGHIVIYYVKGGVENTP